MKKNKKIKKAKKTEKKKLPKTTILDILNEKDSSSKLLPSALTSEIKPFTKRKRQNSQNTSRTISVNQTIITNNKSISTSNNITSIIPNSNEEYNKQIKSKIVIKDGKFSIEKNIVQKYLYPIRSNHKLILPKILSRNVSELTEPNVHAIH